MSTHPSSQADAPLNGPALICRPLPEFDSSDLDSVRRAFETATACSLGQSWQATKSQRFAPAAVRTGWRSNKLLVYAELTDVDIFTRATRTNERMWELGDAFEIFLRPEDQETYVEFQVSPNNQRLQLRYSGRAEIEQARETGKLDDVTISGEAFQSRTWIEADRSRWHVLAEIPASTVCESDVSLEGGRWHFSFSRYDYTRGFDEPEISSTSPHPVADFHRQEDWGIIRFVSAE